MSVYSSGYKLNRCVNVRVVGVVRWVACVGSSSACRFIAQDKTQTVVVFPPVL